MTDQTSITMDYAYDKLDRLTGVIDALDGITAFTFDNVGNKLTQADVEDRFYVALGRVTLRSCPLLQSQSSSYDAVGNVIRRVDFKGSPLFFIWHIAR